MDKKSIFAERLQELMNVNNINGLALSKEIGCGHNSISRYLHGENPSLEILINIANYFKCSTDFLLGFTEDTGNQKFVTVPPFKEQLPRLLKFYGITRYRFQKMTELSPSLVYYYSKGEKSPTLDVVIRIAKRLECPVDLVIGRINS